MIHTTSLNCGTSENLLEVRRVTGISAGSRGSIPGMPRPPRQRPIGRPSLGYDTVQMNAAVHPAVKRRFREMADRKGLSLPALLLQLAADEAGMSVEEFLANWDDSHRSELPMTG